jgi:CheY-like chemotaxis protein
VLYIEDNPVNALVMKAMAERIPGVELQVGEDGASGLRLAAERRPALILTDIQMPGLDGFEVLRRLRADPALRAIPVVAISADAMPQTVNRSRQAGFDDYLTKPVEMAALQACIVRHLQAGRTQSGDRLPE